MKHAYRLTNTTEEEVYANWKELLVQKRELEEQKNYINKEKHIKIEEM